MRSCVWRIGLPSRLYALYFLILLLSCHCSFVVHARIIAEASSSSLSSSKTRTDETSSSSSLTSEAGSVSSYSSSVSTCGVLTLTTQEQQQQQQQQQHDEAVAHEYLEHQKYCITKTIATKATTSLKYNFKFHGWKWHTAAVLYELKLLLYQAQKIERQQEQQQEQQHELQQAQDVDETLLVHKFQQMMDHVLDFTMHGLFRIQTTLFFPWLMERLEKRPDFMIHNKKGKKEDEHHDSVTDKININDQHDDVVQSMSAFSNIIQVYKRHQYQMESLRQELVQITLEPSKRNESTTTNHNSNDDDDGNGETTMETTTTTNSTTTANETTATTLIYNMILEIQEIIRLQHEYLIPMIGCLTTPWEQTKMNTKILQSLGLWESRLYLVSMQEAILHLPTEKERNRKEETRTTDHNTNDHDKRNKMMNDVNSHMTMEEELALFQQEIPYLFRTMIPRWKRLLYDVVMAREATTTTSAQP